ncbi:AAA family ATPase [Clostridium swellfunianum]|uniref:AAA family ATPase n=1 Tax=Clostridium swellfunianum TaxID=1367462 RepID=UPI00202EAD7F|nr:AAA family ATPase [Clostridium swellfunianum]
MIKRIHIMGASGSGTTTLARALSEKIGYTHFDSDNYYWVSTPIRFTQKRDREERNNLLIRDLESSTKWVLSGSLCRWDNILIPDFELVVYLSLPKEIRIQRLLERERQRYGAEIEPNGSRHQLHNEFIEWASQYDEAGPYMRSKSLHSIWLSNLSCPVLRIEGDKTVEERLNIILSAIE